MAASMFMKVDGTTGESKDSKHKGWSDIQSFSWGASQPGSMAAGGGGGAGKASFNDLYVTAYMDKSSPAIIKHCATGKHLDKIELSACKSGGDQIEFAKITLEEVLVTSAQVKGTDPNDPQERLIMNYGFQAARVRKQYWEQTDRGGQGAEIAVAWNIKENKEM
ncbi:Hcp family type VI secretion system effector [Chitinolyticbacter meiyuanensis]|uniref:Hcp family type VI secretion system effector n=1 Tax=Chitinolyticbacter meiyuanensis TaxID=682798 RepID=UPI0011E59D39|nr:type VI secretion system tube protein Hcp [Chitinolyticbacter meiyuanensis]